MKTSVLGFVVFFLYSLLVPVFSWGADIADYCMTPPFIQQGIKANLLMLIDNSASMYDLAYQDTTNKYCANAPTTACTPTSTTDATSATCSAVGAFCLASSTSTTTSVPAACTTDSDCQPPKPGGVINDTCFQSGKNKNTCKTALVITTTVMPIVCTTDATCSALTPGDTCNNKCNAGRQCYDTTYIPYTSTTNYYGYFEAAATYGYDFTTGKFTTGGVSMPLTCTYANTNTAPNTPATSASTYVCVNTTGTAATETVVNNSTGFVASGNFLNWLTASKFDIEKKILTGGKFDTANSVLVAESRGCGGREFLKSLPGVPNLTFAIRGGTSGGIGSTQSLAAEYGQSYIDIYAGVYNAAACLSATNDWIGVISGAPPNLGTFQGDSKACVGAGTTALNPTNMWNHALHNCYKGMLNIAGGYGGNLNPLEGECKSVYLTIPPSSITDPNSGFAICSSALTYTIGSAAYRGYLGACWNGTDFNGPCKNPDNTIQTGMTDLLQMQNYCTANVTTNPVVDPSSSSSVTTASIPGFVMQQGLSNLTKVGGFTVKAGLATTPTGMIDRFKNSIRFGAMAFNIDGSASENAGVVSGSNIPNSKYCSVTTSRLCYLNSDCLINGVQETCGTITNKDSGKIIAFVGEGACSATTATACKVDINCPANEYCVASIGDHTSGLIKAIDDVKATTWTPHAEAFYNAVAYYTKDAVATNALLPTGFVPGGTAISTYLAGSDDYTNKNPIQYRCQQNNILIITDGATTADKNSTMTAKVTDASGNFRDPATTTEGSTCGSYAGTPYLHDLSYYARRRNIFDPTAPCFTVSGSYICEAAQTVKTYGVYTGPVSTSTDVCDPYNQMNKTATNGGTTLYSAVDPSALTLSLKTAFEQIATSASSGTAASILSNSEGSGANLLQAVFYPVKVFKDDTSADWTGEMQNLWYYVDPFISNSSIREDTDFTTGASPTTPAHILDLKKDYAVRFYFANKETSVEVKQDTNGDGVGDVVITAKEDPDDVKSIFRSGKLLWARDATTRTIHTSVDGYSLLSPTVAGGGFYAISDVSSRTVSLKPYLQVADGVEAKKVIDYIRGTDQTGYRSRTVALTVGGAQREWKLGDIVSSTPRLQSSGKLNSYNIESPAGYNDKGYAAFINSANYKARGMVYVGANDGMLHAFKLGKLTVSGVTDVPSVSITGDVKATLTGSNLGEEQWAYIPRSALPYLKYFSDKNAYRHLFYVDGPTVLVDASIGCSSGEYSTCAKDDANGTNWRTLLIGSMGLGGATRAQGNTTCTASNANGTCVKAPIADPTDSATPPTKMVGYSSYFAMDITGQYFNTDGTLANQPTLKWEFPPPDAPDNFGMGYATSGAAIVRILPRITDPNNALNTIADKTKNGKWFAVFASGPTGPIADTRFGGKSDQNLKLFVVDMGAVTPLVLNTNYWVINTGIERAFAGSIVSSVIDTDRWNKNADGNYQDDALYIGYAKAAIDDGSPITSTTTWTDGGVIRVLTKEDTNPNNWTVSPVISGIGPVTTGIAKLQDRKNKKLWLYFGTGRFFYGGDDNTAQRYIMGVQDRCYTTANLIDKNCDATAVAGTDPESSGKGRVLALGDLSPQSSIDASTLAAKKGWYIGLDGQNTSSKFEAERSITDAVALTNGAVFFTTFKPSSDICNYGGNSYMWGVKYDTGGVAPSASLTGKALVQVSTGAFEEVVLGTALNAAGGRKMDTPMTGKPPSDPPPIISNAGNKPVKKILHLQEK